MKSTVKLAPTEVNRLIHGNNAAEHEAMWLDARALFCDMLGDKREAKRCRTKAARLRLAK